METNERGVVGRWLEEASAKTRYAGMTDAQFVNALFQNAELACAHDCQDLTATLTSGRETRDSVLRHVAAKMRSRARHYNDAYVLIHYFAYFGRDPSAPPDHDLKGFEFWRHELDSTWDYLGITRAFLESAEYRDRRIE